jgi:hypothetical protein
MRFYIQDPVGGPLGYELRTFQRRKCLRPDIEDPCSPSVEDQNGIHIPNPQYLRPTIVTGNGICIF